MTFHRLMIAAAIFLAATWMKVCLPEQAEAVLEAAQVQIDVDGFALPLPGEALAWLDWS